MTMGVPVVIDCDPGIDDALAIALAASLPDVEIVGFTTVFGNASVDTTTRNACGLAALLGLAIPVARGARRPLASDFHGGVPHVHGSDGMGESAIIDNTDLSMLSELPAALQLIKFSQTYAGALTIVALGPLTNIALAAQIDPDFSKRIAKLVIMGGNAICPGNATPAAEANMWNDPEAADFVLGFECPTTMVGLDVTHKVNLTGEQLDRLALSRTPGGQIAKHALPLYRAFFERTNGTDGIFCHDPSVIAYLHHPELFVSRTLPLRVETNGMSRGKTWPAFGDTDDAAPEAWQNRPGIEICTDVDGEAVADFVISKLSSVER